ncbi:MAG TPA: outer membrane beta-barrel protein [Gammaproteobacteria bacterium]|nr:outer membrane beta-barrel protein [Gammaproteobacteria bacterium]
MKKQLRHSLISSAVLLAATTACFAGSYKGENYKGEAMPPCPTPLTLKDGFYLGAQLGYDSYRVRNNANASSILGVDETVSANPALNATGWVGGLFGGYGQYFNEMYYLAGELFVDTSGASTSYNVNHTNAFGVDRIYSKVSVGTSWGVSLLPGLKLNDATLLYIRLGYDQARIKGQGNAMFNSVALGSWSKTSWRGGFNYGLGLESTFYPSWSVRTEYSHTNYGSFSNSVSVAGFGTASSKYSPSDNQFMVGLSYHFA